jgi:hypothetical protein
MTTKRPTRCCGSEDSNTEELLEVERREEIVKNGRYVRQVAKMNRRNVRVCLR